VIVSAFGNKPEDQDAIEFFNAMVNQKRDVLSATVSLAELLRNRPTSPLPKVRHVRAVVFDEGCAEICAKHFPPIVLKEEAAKAAGLPAAYWKFDALVDPQHVVEADRGGRTPPDSRGRSSCR